MAVKQLGFGMVTLPVKLVTATRSKDIAFNQITPKGNRTASQTLDAVTIEAVSRDQLRKGYEWSKGQYVILTPEEVKACAPPSDDLIEIDRFVDESELNPLHYEKSQWLVPEKAGLKPYALLVETIRSTKKVGIAKAVLGTKEQLVAIRVVGKALVLTTMFYADEMLAAPAIEDVKLSKEEKDLAKMLVEAKGGKFDPSLYDDGYRTRLMALIEARAKDGSAPAPVRAAAAAPPVADMVAALKASVAASKKARKVAA